MKLVHSSIGPYGPYNVYLHEASLLVKIREKWLVVGSLPPPAPDHPAHQIHRDTHNPLWVTGVFVPQEMESWLDICTVSQTLFKDRSEMVAVRSYPGIHQVD